MVVVNCVTKYNHLSSLAHPLITSSIVVLFFNNVVKNHGLPRSVVSGRERSFISNS